MTPASARSSPAISRSVVVLPQPLGPSRVTSLTSGMSRSMPSTALADTARPRYRLTTPVSLIIDSPVPDAEPAGEQAHATGEDAEKEHEHDAERRHHRVGPVGVEVEDLDRDDLGARRVQEDRRGHLPERDD